MNKSQNSQDLQNSFVRFGGTQLGRRRKAGQLAAFHLELDVL